MTYLQTFFNQIFLRMVVFMLLFMSSISASPTLYGPSGLITVPTAEALRFRELNIGVDYFMKDMDQQDLDQVYYKLNLGTFQNCELGLVGGTVPEEGVFVNVKYFAVNEEERFPLSLALGIENLSSKLNSSVYMVASKKFRGGLNGHIGFNACFKSEGDSSRVVPNMMGGVEYFFSDFVSLVADIKGDDDYYNVNLGANYHVLDYLMLRLHYLDVGNVNNQGSSINFGAVITKFM